ncbi:MAG: HEAT repeat domain-containing protein, partial [Methanothrix sp.]
SRNVEDRSSAAGELGSSFAQLPDKEHGWEVLLKLTQDQDSNVRRSAACALRLSFALLPDKNQGWEILLRLTQDPYSFVREIAADALGTSFVHLSDKTGGWQDLLRLTQDPYSFVRWITADALGTSFAHLPNKIEGWQDFHRLTQNQDRDMRWISAKALGTSFAHLPNKTEGWQDLHRLTQDSDSEVRWGAALALRSSFTQLPDKKLAWQDLHRLAQDQDSDVRGSAALALGSSFALLPDKEQAWQDLHRLAHDKHSEVRMYAYHSLGSVSIRKASEFNDKNTLRSELEASVKFFERSSQERPIFNPASFCLPFYRSYLAMTFQGASEAEVKRYLAEAKKAVGSSENKKELLGAVENLAKALEEAQNIKNKSKEQIQSDLRAYRWYCDRAAENMAAAEEKTPGAVRLMRKCNPIIEERIEETIAGIQKTTREIRQVTHGSGTKYEAPGDRINQETSSLSSEDPINAFKSGPRIASILREFCGLLPKDKRGHACEIVDEIEAEQELSGRLSKIELALTYLQPNIRLEAYESVMAGRLDQMDKKLDIVIHDLAKIKIGSGNILANLCAVRSGLAAIAEMERKSANPKRISELPSPPNADQKELGNLIEAKVLELEEILKTKATKEEIQAILDKLESLKPSAGWEWLGRMADLIAVFDASIKLLQSLA